MKGREDMRKSSMQMKEHKGLENTRVTRTFGVASENGIIRNIGNSTIMQPKVQFSGKPMRWFDDSKLLKKKQK